MDVHVTAILLLMGLTFAFAQHKHSKRRQNGFQKPIFNFRQQPPVIPQQPPVPQQQPSSVEVERAEIRSSEYVPNQELEGPLLPQFHQDNFQEPPRNSFRRTDETTPLPKDGPTPIPIIRLEKQQSLDGSYKSNYETGNLIQAEETGFLKNVGVPEQEALVQFGSYSYTDPDGQVVSVSYTADEGGFRATGSHLPTPPPVPPEVQKGLDIIFESIRQEAEKKAKDKKLKGSKFEPENYPEQDDGQYVSQPRPQQQHRINQQNQGRQPVRN